METIKIKKIEEDKWGRKRFQNIDNGNIYALVDNKLYTTTKDGEPSCTLREDLNVLRVDKIIKIQPTEKNPIVVENYPYGWLKTQIRYWVESVKKKGDRFCSQTLNPKTQEWNKPKKSTYCNICIVYEDEKGYITYYGFSSGADEESYNKFIEFKGDLQLNELQEEELKVIKAYVKAHKGVSFECVESTGWSDEKRAEHDEEQDKIKNQINNMVVANYHNDTEVLK